MAQLNEQAPISATTQLLAVAWLRWRMFANGFRRRKTGTRQIVGLIFTILLRLILWPIFAVMAIGPAAGAGFLAWKAASGHDPEGLILTLGGLAIFWQFVAINGIGIAAQTSNFDPSSLLRFPLRFGRYLFLRLLLGLLTPSTIIGFLACLAAAIGIAVADLSLAPAAFVVLGIYAAMNLFLARMIAAWLERWLATRRAREIFGGAMALFFVSMQMLNFSGTHAHAAATRHWLLSFVHVSNGVLHWLPPGFAANSIFPGDALTRLAQFAALLAWAALFFAAFAFRLHKQFLGEYLSEGAPRSAPAAASAPRRPEARATNNVEPTTDSRRPAASAFLSPVIAACLRKEWVYLRGNGNQLIAILTPLVFVVIFSRGVLARHPSYLLTGAIGYALFGLLANLYNIFGPDGAGVQLYLLAPIRLRDVVLAKNIASLTLLMLEAVLAWSVALAFATAPIPLPTQVSAAFWIVFVIFINLTLGTYRSIQAPRKFVPGKTPQVRASAPSKTSGLLILAILFGSIVLQVPVTYLCKHFGNLWLGACIFAPLAFAAVGAYALLLRNADDLILTHRDLFTEELCKA